MRDIPHAEAARLVVAMHYTRGAPKTSTHAHGLVRAADGAVMGAALWLPPIVACARSVHAEWRRVLALSRLVIDPQVPANGASFLLGRSVRLIAAERYWRALVTFADGAQGHTGAIYRATNWTDEGERKSAPRWLDSSGRQVSIKATASRTYAEMADLGYRRVEGATLRRFTMLLPRPDARNPEAKRGQLRLLP